MVKVQYLTLFSGSLAQTNDSLYNTTNMATHTLLPKQYQFMSWVPYLLQGRNWTYYFATLTGNWTQLCQSHCDFSKPWNMYPIHSPGLTTTYPSVLKYAYSPQETWQSYVLMNKCAPVFSLIRKCTMVSWYIYNIIFLCEGCSLYCLYGQLIYNLKPITIIISPW